jgi:hypothetical protein
MPSISFIPQSLDIACYAGDGALVRLSVTQGGNPLDVSGNHEAQIRAKRLDTDPVDIFNIDDDEAFNGILIMSLTGEQTSGFGDGFKGVWDLQWTASGAEPVTLIQGSISCVLDVTRLP